MPSPRAAAFLATLLAAGLVPPSSLDARLAGRTVGAGALDFARLDYREDGDSGRVIAEARARLVPRDGGVALELTASALGSQVVAPAGPEGVRGANRITAQEIARLVRDGRARLLVHREGAPAPWPGEVRPGRRGRLPERTLDRADRTPAAGPDVLLELVADSGPLPAGRHRADLVVGRVPRLRAHVVIGPHGARIERLEDLGDPASEIAR